MATATLRPIYDGDEADFTPVGDDRNWKCVDEASPDEGATFMSLGYVDWWRRTVLLMSEFGLDYPINKVTIFARCKISPGGLYMKCSIRSGGVTADSPAKAASGSEYTTRSHVWVTPPEGGIWTQEKLFYLQAGCAMYMVEQKDCLARCTQVYAEVDYTLGWQGKISGVTNPAQVMGVNAASIARVKGVASA